MGGAGDTGGRVELHGARQFPALEGRPRIDEQPGHPERPPGRSGLQVSDQAGILAHLPDPGPVDIGGTSEKEEILYSAGFEFPKWRGHLRSWDVSNLSLSYTRASEIQDIKSVNAVLVRDAGEMLAAKSSAARRIFSAYEGDGDGRYNDRVPFAISETAILDDYLGLGQASPEAVPLIQFVRGYDTVSARERPWKLGDINHSSPQALLPPSDNPVRMGGGYEAFMNDQADRPKVILVGANDGMLHCFDPVTLEELWGFIPNNLLPKLRRMKYIDPDCGEYVNHEFFVDGTPAIGDVFINGDWRTVLICGQGSGWGRDNLCYYFCLDITDPLNPQPLWEFTDAAYHRPDLVNPGHRPHLHRPVGRLLRLGLRQQ